MRILQNPKVTVVDWYIKKYFTEDEQWVIANSQGEVSYTTEKYVRVRWIYGYKFIEKMVPRNCTLEYMSDEHRARYEEQERRRKVPPRTTPTASQYDQVLAFAKHHKVPGVRRGYKLETLIRKIQEAGIMLPDNLR